MASNSFGQLFKITTWGESHGTAIGVVIDGCPAGVPLTVEHIQSALNERAPGQNNLTSPRREPDIAVLNSGVFDGRTTGAPIAIQIANKDADSSKYAATRDLLKPGHANFTYLQKYGCFDHRGGGRASARETASRVAAGAVAEQWLQSQNIQVVAHLKQVGAVQAPSLLKRDDIQTICATLTRQTLFCLDAQCEAEMILAIEQAKAEGDSLGGVVEFALLGLPAGLGDPVYEKLEAKLASAMMSIPASKGFEIGEGFAAATMRGSEHNDGFTTNVAQPTRTNHAGGLLGGISTGMPVIGRVAFKPTSSIRHPQATCDVHGQAQTFQLPPGSRHDPCVAIRAVPVVAAMCRLVVADCLLLQRAQAGATWWRSVEQGADNVCD